MKKYELTDECIMHEGIKLYRIRRLSDGLLGGYVESEDNLSHNGDCFVHDGAYVYGNAKVSGDAIVYANAKVYGNAKVSGNASVYGNAKVYADAKVYGNASVYGNAYVSGDARVFANAEVFGNAKVCENARVSGDAIVYANAEVFGNAKVCENARVSGNAKVGGNNVITDIVSTIHGLYQYNFTISVADRHIRVGCKAHSFDEWQRYVDTKSTEYVGECNDAASHKEMVKMIKLLLKQNNT